MHSNTQLICSLNNMGTHVPGCKKVAPKKNFLEHFHFGWVFLREILHKAPPLHIPGPVCSPVWIGDLDIEPGWNEAPAGIPHEGTTPHPAD